MPRHKTAHRQALEAQQKANRALRNAVVAELAAGDSLKANAQANARKSSGVRRSK